MKYTSNHTIKVLFSSFLRPHLAIQNLVFTSNKYVKERHHLWTAKTGLKVHDILETVRDRMGVSMIH